MTSSPKDYLELHCRFTSDNRHLLVIREPSQEMLDWLGSQPITLLGTDAHFMWFDCSSDEIFSLFKITWWNPVNSVATSSSIDAPMTWFIEEFKRQKG